jgi:drug/metabolite transporter (DMT)-like permease
VRRDQAGLGAAATISLGVPFLLIEVAQRSFSTTAMAASRVMLAALTLGLLMLWSRRARRDAHEFLTTRPLTATFVALTAALAPNVMIGAGEHHVSTGATAVILALTPVWIAIGTTFLGVGERVEVRQAAALVAAVVGVGLVCSAAAPQGAWGWYVLPLLASISYAISALVVPEPAHVPPAGRCRRGDGSGRHPAERRSRRGTRIGCR